MLYLFNTTIMPNEGVYVCKQISRMDAEAILKKYSQVIATGNFPAIRYNFTSALGHQGSVDAFNALFEGLNCELNRIQAKMLHGDEAICLKVLGRLPEGAILDFDTLQQIGFEFYHVTCFAGTWMAKPCAEVHYYLNGGYGVL